MLYEALGGQGLDILDVSDPTNPQSRVGAPQALLGKTRGVAIGQGVQVPEGGQDQPRTVAAFVGGGDAGPGGVPGGRPLDGRGGAVGSGPRQGVLPGFPHFMRRGPRRAPSERGGKYGKSVGYQLQFREVSPPSGFTNRKLVTTPLGTAVLMAPLSWIFPVFFQTTVPHCAPLM